MVSLLSQNVVPRPAVSISPTIYEKYKFLYILIYPGVYISKCSVLTVLFSLIYTSLQLAFIEYLYMQCVHCAECYGEINKKKIQGTPTWFCCLQGTSKLFWKMGHLYEKSKWQYNKRQCVHAQSSLILCDLMDCSLSGSFVHGIF